jgi:hypothetical protein
MTADSSKRIVIKDLVMRIVILRQIPRRISINVTLNQRAIAWLCADWFSFCLTLQ